MEDYLTIGDAAKLLNITVGGVHHLIKVGTIQAERKGGLIYLIHKSELAKAETRKGKGRPRGT